MNSSGDITMRVVPSRQGVFSLSTTCPALLICTRSLASAACIVRARASDESLHRRGAENAEFHRDPCQGGCFFTAFLGVLCVSAVKEICPHCALSTIICSR